MVFLGFCLNTKERKIRTRAVLAKARFRKPLATTDRDNLQNLIDFQPHLAMTGV